MNTKGVSLFRYKWHTETAQAILTQDEKKGIEEIYVIYQTCVCILQCKQLLRAMRSSSIVGNDHKCPIASIGMEFNFRIRCLFSISGSNRGTVQIHYRPPVEVRRRERKRFGREQYDHRVEDRLLIRSLVGGEVIRIFRSNSVEKCNVSSFQLRRRILCEIPKLSATAIRGSVGRAESVHRLLLRERGLH